LFLLFQLPIENGQLIDKKHVDIYPSFL